MRITKVYTRQGDEGRTTIGMGKSIPKTDERIEVIGEIDELNAVIGHIRSVKKKEAPQTHSWLELDATLLAIQHDLFNIGGELSLPGEDCSKFMPIIEKASLENMEEFIDLLQSKLSPLKEFVLPGGSELNALFHVARTVCRRAERSFVKLSNKEDQRKELLAYLNRLSDLLFVMSRYVSYLGEEKEILWDKTKGLKHFLKNSEQNQYDY
jgi:cob(I)alamin adenosyltransferase